MTTSFYLSLHRHRQSLLSTPLNERYRYVGKAFYYATKGELFHFYFKYIIYHR